MNLFDFSSHLLQSYQRNEYDTVLNKYNWNVYATKHNTTNADTQFVELLRMFENIFGNRMRGKREMIKYPIDLD